LINKPFNNTRQNNINGTYNDIKATFLIKKCKYILSRYSYLRSMRRPRYRFLGESVFCKIRTKIHDARKKNGLQKQFLGRGQLICCSDGTRICTCTHSSLLFLFFLVECVFSEALRHLRVQKHCGACGSSFSSGTTLQWKTVENQKHIVVTLFLTVSLDWMS